MKNILTAVYIVLVAILTLVLVSFIINYGKTNKKDDIQIEKHIQAPAKEKQVSNYLDKLESYKDVDVQIDPKTVSSKANIATVETEIKKGEAIGNIGNIVQSTEKSENYVGNLEKYNPTQDINTATQSDKNGSEDGGDSADKILMKKDPLGDIASDIDSVINSSGEAK